MQLISKLAGAAVAVVAMATISLTLRPQAGGEAGVAGSPSLVPSPAASPLAYAWPGHLAAGTYSTDFAFVLPEAMTFTVGDGWDGRDINIIKNDRMSLMLLAVENLHTGPMQRGPSGTRPPDQQWTTSPTPSHRCPAWRPRRRRTRRGWPDRQVPGVPARI